MQTTNKKHYLEFSSSDNNGDYSVQIQKDGSQLRLSSEGGDTLTYIDTNKTELIAIRNMIDKIIKSI